MRLLLATFLLLTTHTPLFAAESNFQVEVDPYVYPLADFSQEDVKAGIISRRVRRPDAIPDKSERDRTFALVPGLEGEIAKMDELDRDILFVRAKTKSLKELTNFYPQLAEKKLAQLMKVARKNNN